MTFLMAAGHNSTQSLNDVAPGVLGFLVVAALGVALVFLLRSMNKHLRKIGPKPVDPIGLEDLEAVHHDMGHHDMGPDDAGPGDVPAGAVPGEVLHSEDSADTPARRD